MQYTKSFTGGWKQNFKIGGGYQKGGESNITVGWTTIATISQLTPPILKLQYIFSNTSSVFYHEFLRIHYCSTQSDFG